MKVTQAAVLLMCTGSAFAAKSQSNPLGSVLDLLTELSAKITKDGEVEAKAYHEYVEWCDDISKNTKFSIETATNQKAKLEAQIGELTGNIGAAGSQIDELAASISTAEADLNDATDINKHEHADFMASEAELMDAIDTLGRAISILEKEMAQNPAAFAQVDAKNMAGAMHALSVVLDAASFNSKDQAKLTAFVQSQQTDDADDLDLGAPAAATYKTHSTGILDVLEDLKEKAEGQLSDLRKAEVNTRHNFEMMKQSLEDQIAADSKDMGDEKSGKASAEEARSSAKGDLQITSKEMANSQQQLATAHSTCLQVASDHQVTVAAREAELKVIAEAKKMLQETTSGAVSQTYSLFQVASLTGFRMKTHSDLAGSEVVVAVKQLAKREHSSALAQLASRIATVLRYGSVNGEDPFAKVKSLIIDMVAKLENEAGEEATEKAYCDEQIAKTEAKKGELEEDTARQTSRIDRASAKSTQLRQEISALENELSLLAREQAQMDTIRQESHADFVVAKSDLEKGLSGVRKALEVLREYYGGAAMLQDDTKFGAFMQQPTAPETHSKASGAGNGIINILQVVESDFATNLATEETEEDDAQSKYETVSQQNAVTKTLKDQDVKYKTQESKSLDKTAAEYSADRETSGAELSAVLEYYTQIKARCIAKPEAYADRKARRAAEIDGLKQALSILEDETALVQRKRRGHFRGTMMAL